MELAQLAQKMRNVHPFSTLSDAEHAGLLQHLTHLSQHWPDDSSEASVGDMLDRLSACSPELVKEVSQNAGLLDRFYLVCNALPFRRLPAERLETALLHGSLRVVDAGETVLTQGDRYDYFYLLEQGEAEIWRKDPMTDETACVDRIGPGSTFGEEALIMDGFRNATIKMLTRGLLWRLTPDQFNTLLRDALIDEIDVEAAKSLVDQGHAAWLDCRYDMEFEDAHIPGAQWLPLDSLRQRVDEIRPEQHYIVYCRSGRRSASATFLLRERGFKAVSLAGGIKAWPYEVNTVET